MMVKSNTYNGMHINYSSTSGYPTVSKAARHINVGSTAISRVASGKRKSVKGWAIYYAEG